MFADTLLERVEQKLKKPRKPARQKRIPVSDLDLELERAKRKVDGR